MLVATGTIGEMTEWWRRGLARFSAAEIVTVIIAAGGHACRVDLEADGG